MEHALRREPVGRLSLDALPELPTRIGMAGAMRHAEVGGSSCAESGILIATIRAAARATLALLAA